MIGDESTSKDPSVTTTKSNAMSNNPSGPTCTCDGETASEKGKDDAQVHNAHGGPSKKPLHDTQPGKYPEALLTM